MRAFVLLFYISWSQASSTHTYSVNLFIGCDTKIFVDKKNQHPNARQIYIYKCCYVSSANKHPFACCVCADHLLSMPSAIRKKLRTTVSGVSMYTTVYTDWGTLVGGEGGGGGHFSSCFWEIIQGYTLSEEVDLCPKGDTTHTTQHQHTALHHTVQHREWR